MDRGDLFNVCGPDRGKWTRDQIEVELMIFLKKITEIFMRKSFAIQLMISLISAQNLVNPLSMANIISRPFDI